MQHGQLQAAVAVEVADGQVDRALEHAPSLDRRFASVFTAAVAAERERRAGGPAAQTPAATRGSVDASAAGQKL